jgi:hypothetical protein
MALIDKASLLMVPSTYEAGKLYNVLPSGNRAPDSTDQNSGYDQTRADFDFDRGTDHAATRVNADGLIEKYRENKLLQSNQFDTTWTNASSSETSGQSGYDGTNNAWLLTTTGTGGYIIQNVVNTGVQTFSVYAKANTYNFIRIQLNGSGADKRIDVDLRDGTTGTAGSGNITAKATSIGDGWYRVEIVSNTTSSAARIYAIVGDNDLTGTSGSIYIQSAQLESGLVSTDYLDSTDVTAKAGVLVDLPRINYDANGENGALLLEPSRLQMLRYSEYANEWDVDSNVTTTINAATSPEGVLNAVKLEGLTTSANNQIFRFIGSNTGVSVVGETFSCSLYIKPVNPNDVGKNIELSIQRTAGDYEGLNQTFEIDSADWKRYDLSYTFTGAGSGNQTGVTFKVLRNSTTIDDIYCYGAQCEEASYPSSYIPNHGESGGVTRAADTITSGTITAPLSGGYTAFIELETLSTSVYNQIQFRETAANYVLRIGNQINVGAGSTIQTNTTGMNKFALQVSSGGAYELFKNGSSVATGTGITHDIELIKTDLAGQDVKQIAVFNEALTDAECVTLTTL